MEKVAPQQQLSLPFDSCPEVLTFGSNELAVSSIQNNAGLPVRPAAILDFRHAHSKREAQKSSAVYRKILESVSHIG